MTKKIFWSVFLVAMVVFLACFGIIMAAMYGYFSEIQSGKLKDQTDLAVHGVAIGGLDYLESLQTDEYRITWIGEDGDVIFDSAVNTADMDNHADREEVHEAQLMGVGESERHSSTLAIKTLYRAVKMDDDSILRVSVTQYTIFSLILSMIQPILIICIIALFLSFLLAHNISKRIVDPMNDLDLDHPLENDSYDELLPLLTRLELQHRQIAYQKEELNHKQNEFNMVTDNMDQGLVLLNAKGIVISINVAAMRFFRTDRHCIGKDFLFIEYHPNLQSIVRGALEGNNGELRMERHRRKYRIKVDTIRRDDQITGAVLLLFDVEQEDLAEQRRREFTANVSHELKSPLQSIMGSAELVESGIVKEEDRPRFMGRIRSEAERLVVLIDDIIRLSQLDEGSELPMEDMDLLEMAKETKDSLENKAFKRGISIGVDGESVVFHGVRRMVSEILYNLCDNALKYNKENGSVTMTVTKEDSFAVITVADTGIGIPEEHLGRVFERFYRVDKSHSRETGGTGLGLSIVKHAAQFHGAVVDVKSKEGEGTTFTVKFPL
ncbi:MAG: ATP-binding protein [Firmicutes bacterium]|nr:ATP-binding protein [Bacillota bacterium]